MLKRFIPIVLLLAACWVVFLVNNYALSGRLLQYGIRPREISSLTGILWSPFLHGSMQHLVANSVPLLVLGAIICARGNHEFAKVTVAGIFLGGGLVWIFGRHASHVGASGLIFCFFGYLASLAYFKRNFPTLCLSIVCLLAYGGMLRGILPTSAAVSWEAHLAGLISGIWLAWLSSKTRRTAE
jgi:membrane associated rhomboid family serine protease